MRNILTVIASLAFLGSILLANWLTSRYHFVAIGFGFTATAGTYAAGAALLARDFVQDTLGRKGVLFLIAVGAILSWYLASPALAIASGVAFAIAELADMAIYTPLRTRGWGRAALASGLVGGLVDTIAFLYLAGFPIWSAVPGQMIGKVLWSTALPVTVVLLIREARNALLRESVHP